MAEIVLLPRAMPWRGLALVVLTYVSLDLSSPFVPGAFNFDPSECVDGLRHARPHGTTRADQPATSAPAPSTAFRMAEESRLTDRPLIATPHAGDWLIDLKRAHPPSREVSSLSDDH